MTSPQWGQTPIPRRLLLGAFGDPGHAFPMIALGEALVARGHDVTLQTWERWRAEVEAAGMAFAPAPEYRVFPTREHALRPYEAVVHATRDTRPLVAELRPDAVVADILTLAPALAAELEGVPAATLVPHVHPAGAAGFPPYSLGARLPRTRLGARGWDLLGRVVERGVRRGREELNDTRRRLGLPALAHVHGGLSRELCLVATFPQLEYPRPWPAGTHVVGPLLWEPPAGAVELPPGNEPLVLIAPSTSQDPSHALLRAAVEGLADEPVRVLAAWNRRPLDRPLRVPANARVVEWVSYAQTMPHCAAVVCHGGHGTVARALACGVPVVVCPEAGDMNENAARVDWAGVGVRLPRRMLAGWSIRLAVRRVLEDRRVGERACDLRDSYRHSEPGQAAAELVERFAEVERPAGWGATSSNASH